MLRSKSSLFSYLDVQVLKYDILTKSSLTWSEEHCWPMEPLFVPTPGAKDEDDGKTPGRGACPLYSACDHPSNRDVIWGQGLSPHHTASGVLL